MTTLAGIQGKGWCVIGAESKASEEDGTFVYMPDPKIFTNGCVLIAGCGDVRGLNVMEFGWNAPRYSGKSVEQYVTRSFIPSLRKAMISAGSDMKEDSKTAIFANGLIIAVKGKLFSISEDYSWDRSIKGLYQYGSGGKYALGSMNVLGGHTVSTPEEAESIVRLSIQSAIECDMYSGGEIITFTQYE
jgi:hypothetical protein